MQDFGNSIACVFQSPQSRLKPSIELHEAAIICSLTENQNLRLCAQCRRDDCVWCMCVLETRLDRDPMLDQIQHGETAGENRLWAVGIISYIDGLVQERRNSSSLAIE